jgi:hypothetical protein
LRNGQFEYKEKWKTSNPLEKKENLVDAKNKKAAR